MLIGAHSGAVDHLDIAVITCGQSDAEATAHANAKKPSIRASIDHVFAHQKNRYSLFIRTIKIKRADVILTSANLTYNMDRLIFHECRRIAGSVCP